MELFGKYLRSRLKWIVLFLLCAAAFIITFLLYDADKRAVIYPACICLALGAAFLAWDFVSVKRRHDDIMNIKSAAAAVLSELPAGTTIYEEDLKRIIGLLREEISDIKSRDELKYRDTVDYYTVWVHQIKTPIAAMRLQLENDDALNARRLSSELTRIERYVDMVLTYVKVEHDESDLVFREHELSEIVKKAVRSFAPEFIDRKISVELDVPEKTVITDDKWLLFVLEQLISNALKYTKSGTVRIYLKDDVLCIEDQGEGIAPEDLPRIFDKGFTGYNGRTYRKATGLGLYLCKRLCGDLGIGISAESEQGRGTVMMLDLSQRRRAE